MICLSLKKGVQKVKVKDNTTSSKVILTHNLRNKQTHRYLHFLQLENESRVGKSTKLTNCPNKTVPPINLKNILKMNVVEPARGMMPMKVEMPPPKTAGPIFIKAFSTGFEFAFPFSRQQ